MITRRQISAAHTLIAPYIRRTPVIDVSHSAAVRPVTLKIETLQYSGSFKPRGAYNNLLSASIPASGVTAASGGNHGAAVAYAAKQIGVRSRIYLPLGAPPAKVERIRNYGAEIVEAGESYAAAYELSCAYASASGALAVHAYDSEPTIAGQGTIALELEEQTPDLDTVLVGVGGGGLIAGVAAWYSSGLKIISVEPENCPTLERALANGAPVDISPSGIAADSLGASRIGSIPFALAEAYVDHAILVSDAEIDAARLWLWENLRIAAEPGGATAFAALNCGAYRPDNHERVGIILCGANLDLTHFAAGMKRPPMG